MYRFAESYGYPQKKKKASKYPQVFVRVKFLHFLGDVTMFAPKKTVSPMIGGRNGIDCSREPNNRLVRYLNVSRSSNGSSTEHFELTYKKV